MLSPALLLMLIAMGVSIAISAILYDSKHNFISNELNWRGITILVFVFGGMAAAVAGSVLAIIWYL